jgi:hypothetical protein
MPTTFATARPCFQFFSTKNSTNRIAIPRRFVKPTTTSTIIFRPATAKTIAAVDDARAQRIAHAAVGIVFEDERQWTSTHIGAAPFPARELVGAREDKRFAGER